MREFKLKSFDNTEIFVTIWDDVKNPKGVVQIVHGMSDYGGTYDGFAKYLNSRGYIVFADDHRAHGRTETDKSRGHHRGNVFKLTLQDELFFREYLQKEYNLPVFYLGHSYGSFLGQAFAECGTDVKAIALVGTAHSGALFKLCSILLAPLYLFANKWKPKVGNYVADRAIQVKGDSGQLQWLNSIKERREEYVKGPYTHIDMSINFDFHFVNETSKLYSRKARLKLNPATAIDIFNGEEDPIGRNGKAVEKLHKFYEESGIKCNVHMYKGARHEVIYDKCSSQVQKDIADFYDKFIIYKQPSLF